MLVTFLAATILQTTPQDAKLVDLKDGYVRVETATYQLEVPKDWKVTAETRWGQRKFYPEGKGELGAMTAPPSQQSWDQLYETALYFILRDEEGKPTPYEKTKTKQGYEAASFSVLNKEGFATQRFMMIKHETKGLLALSIKIPSQKDEEKWTGYFKRMVDTAIFK